MNFVNIYHLSRFFVRNIEGFRLTQVYVGKTVNRIGKPSAATWRARQPVWLCSGVNGENYKNRSRGHSKRRSWQQRLGAGAGAGGTVVSAAFSFNFFRSAEEDNETPEDKLINTIKRSLLCIQGEQYDKAEQMLHLALRMAQDLQSREGVTYVFDVMANLAMEREQFKKAEKLFADVMKRLFADGYAEDSPQVLHISVKLAHMAQLQGELDKAMQGFTWTLKKIQENIQKMPGDKEIQELLGLTKNWFGQLLMKQGKYADAKKSFQEAYDCLVEIYGKENKEAITILNNLSVACVNMDDLDEAEKYLLQALELVKEIKDSSQEGVLQANLGLIYLQEGLISQAKELCTLAWRIGKKNKNADAIEQAEYCLNEVKSYYSKNRN